MFLTYMEKCGGEKMMMMMAKINKSTDLKSEKAIKVKKLTKQHKN